MDNRFLVNGLAAALLSSGAGLALAQGSGGADPRLDPRRSYFGGAIGGGFYDTDFKRNNDEIRSTGATSFSSDANSTGTMWKVYGGYRFSPYVSFEAGYWNFGNLDVKTKIFAPVSTKMERRYDGGGIGADALLWLPMSTSLSGLVRAGAMRTSIKAGSSDPGGGLSSLSSESAQKINAHWGVGLELRLTGAAAARVEYESVRNVGDNSKFGAADINMVTVGANYRF
jgi:opacity protein-like surface antigen